MKKIILVAISILPLSIYADNCNNAKTTMDMIECGSNDIYYSNCNKVETTLEQKGCLNTKLRQANIILNSTYKSLAKMEDAKGKVLLAGAQKAWIKYRDAEAEFHADHYRGGTLAGVEYLQTLLDLVQKRTKELKQISSNEMLPR